MKETPSPKPAEQTEKSSTLSKEQMEQMSRILVPIFKELEDSSKEAYKKARTAIYDALETVQNDGNTYQQDMHAVRYFHRQMTRGLLKLMEQHMVLGVDEPKVLADFIQQALIREGQGFYLKHQAEELLKSRNQKRPK